MVLVVLGIDALDPELVDSTDHPNLTLDSHRSIETINSVEGEPSTHELWPTIITGLTPEEHGLKLDDGVAWENPLLRYGSAAANYLLPDGLQTRIGAWLLNNTGEDAFRVPATYYQENGLSTVFDGREAATIGIPNYVVDPENEDREHSLRRNLGDLFERDGSAPGGHTSADPAAFYEQCLEMSMIRLARARRALRGGQKELVFAYTSGLDLIGHVSYDHPTLQMQAYGELDEFVGEVVGDLREDDELLLVSDHGLQDGVHTHEAMVAGTSSRLVEEIDSVLDVRGAIETELRNHDHSGPGGESLSIEDNDAVTSQLEDLGYM
ncbi:alkaline phosphatase family protein [Haloarcula sp. S1AR25-5A]|uniref:Alkaline phosphatase family protein n=1 Tax=Haloarcula terrestris TaxID=2950533 RepID=A0AAE4EYS1_9EURY|nr:alkaline phosphatase family protein [Haloarcula terrestris]MDS0221236.1 alkaline phosphatase family protein [Haloarcula terrestris]